MTIEKRFWLEDVTDVMEMIKFIKDNSDSIKIKHITKYWNENSGYIYCVGLEVKG